MASLVATSSDGVATLLDAAEDMRARLLTVPGVGAVRLRGLQTAGLALDYAPARLARLGVTTDDLRRAVPVASDDQPGHMTLRLDAAGGGPDAVAGLPVQAGSRVFRLGDLAAIARTPLPGPLSTLRHAGRPAVDFVVVPAPGSAGPMLDRRVAASLATMQLSPGVRLN